MFEFGHFDISSCQYVKLKIKNTILIIGHTIPLGIFKLKNENNISTSVDKRPKLQQTILHFSAKMRIAVSKKGKRTFLFILCR